MCFVKAKSVPVAAAPVETKQEQQDIVKRHQADASMTKTTQADQKGFIQNVRTSSLGLTDDAEVGKKRLLGE